MEPTEFVERILGEHEARRQASRRPWRAEDDPDGAALVALAAMATRWNVTPSEFEAKLVRLCRTPTATARPAAERMLRLWRSQRSAIGDADAPPDSGIVRLRAV